MAIDEPSQDDFGLGGLAFSKKFADGYGS